jgi:hypothetical protein
VRCPLAGVFLCRRGTESQKFERGFDIEVMLTQKSDSPATRALERIACSAKKNGASSERAKPEGGGIKINATPPNLPVQKKMRSEEGFPKRLRKAYSAKEERCKSCNLLNDC